MFFTRDNQLHDLSADDAYRTWLISRHAPPVRGGGIRWKRLAVAARLVRNHVRSFFASMRVAYVANEMRRVQQELARREARYPRRAERRRGPA